MDQKLYVIYDKLAEESGPIFTAKNDMVALRQYSHLIKDVENQNDYSLECVGVYDPRSCCLVSTHRRSVCDGVAVDPRAETGTPADRLDDKSSVEE